MYMYMYNHVTCTCIFMVVRVHVQFLCILYIQVYTYIILYIMNIIYYTNTHCMISIAYRDSIRTANILSMTNVSCLTLDRE